MIDCQILIFTAILKYGYVLFLVKFRTRMVEDRTEISNPKLHEKIRKLDGAFMVLMPLCFLLFNMIFWIQVSYLNKSIRM